jgi:hypothetical protein
MVSGNQVVGTELQHLDGVYHYRLVTCPSNTVLTLFSEPPEVPTASHSNQQGRTWQNTMGHWLPQKP